ncbi:hypothetical protein RUND412_005161 [Rhizina undulata]
MSVEDITNLLNNIKTVTFRVADTIDRQADALANTIRESLSNSPWLPPTARPPPPPPRVLSVYEGILERVLNWIWSYRYAVMALGIGAVGAGSYGVVARRRNMRKRRARRAQNGARKEVVIIIGEVHEAVTKSLELDLERRGFIVFVVVGSMDDEVAVLNEGREDIRPLVIDVVDTERAQASIEKFQKYLSTPVTAFPTAVPHRLTLTGVILITSPPYPTGPLETLPLDLWSDTLNLKILSTVVILHHLLSTIRTFKSRVLLLTPSIISSLSPAFHAPESVAVNALDALSRSLRKELKDSNVEVCLFKLGTFDTSSIVSPAKNPLLAVNAVRADILSWPKEWRETYARRYAAQVGAEGKGWGVKGSSLRELHVCVFDALTEKRPKGVWRVGRGARSYEFIGRFLPEGLVGWMLGFRSKAGEEAVEEEEGARERGEWEKV